MEAIEDSKNNSDSAGKALAITKTVVSHMSLLFGLAVVLTLSVAIIFWATKPEFVSVAQDVNSAEIADITSLLDANQIKYRLDMAAGQIMVPNTQLQNARLLLSSEGLANSNAAGFEQLQKKQSLGTSQFIESARYQHALETELSRSISKMRNIETARVHLAMPKRSVFVRKNEASTASVMLKIMGGRELEKGQVRSIAQLVSSSVPYLSVDKVTVVDQWGNLLTSGSSDNSLEVSQKQFDYRSEIENAYADRIERMLSPIFGFGRIRAQVNTDIDFTRVESTEELFDPDSAQVRSEQLIDQQNKGGIAGAIGVPGALTNQPPSGGSVDAEAEGASTDGIAVGPQSASKNSIRNYELDKTIRHVRQASGEIRKITVAVVVDDRMVANESGELVRTPLNEEDIALITGIVREAIGYEEARGDRVSVYNESFIEGKIEDLPELPIWQQPWFVNVIKQVFAGIAVLLILFMVVRPAMKTLQGKVVASKSRSGKNTAGEKVDSLDNDTLSISNDGQLAISGQIAPNYVEQLALAKKLAEQDPRQVAKVVKTWVSGNT